MLNHICQSYIHYVFYSEDLIYLGEAPGKEEETNRLIKRFGFKHGN